jgi:5-methylthioadenosine/S-adenosylhomocysteine deaminase
LPPEPERPEPADLVVKGGVIVTVDPDGRVVSADVAVRDGRIVAVQRDIPIGEARAIDARRGAVLPGFVNAHMHECLERGVFEDLPFMTWLEDYALPKDRAYEPRHMRASALMNQAEMIANGTTAFIDIFRYPDVAATIAVATGLRATFSPQLIDDPVGPGETLDSSEAFVAAWAGRHPRIRAWFGPHSLYTVRPETLSRVRELADRYGVGVHTHLAESRAETAIARERVGLTPTQWLDRVIGLGPSVLCAHGVELTDDDVALIASRHAAIAHCPTSNMKLGNGVARVPELLAAGVTVGLGTDSVMTNNNLDPFEEMRMAALIQKQATGDASVLVSRDVLRMATLGSARALGLGDDVGSVEVGKRADLIVVDLDSPHAWPLFAGEPGNVVEQLVWSCNGGDVRHTIVDGHVLMEDRGLTTIDLDEVRDLVDTEARHLLTKAGLAARIGRTS